VATRHGVLILGYCSDVLTSKYDLTRSGDAGQLAVLIAVFGASFPIAVCAPNVFRVLVVSLCIAVSFIVSAITNLHATAAAMADLEALSALSAAWATMHTAALRTWEISLIL